MVARLVSADNVTGALAPLVLANLDARFPSVKPTPPPNVTPVPAGSWDTAAGLYRGRPTRFRRFRGKIATSAAGVGITKIVAIGDSLTAGEGITIPQGRGAYPAAVRDALIAGGNKLIGDGWVNPQANFLSAASKPTQWVLSGAWTVPGDAATMPVVGAGTTNATATFSSTVVGDTVEFSALGNNGEFSYAVDGGTPVIVPLAAASPAIKKYTVGGLPKTTHTLVITIRSSTTNIGPARVFDSNGGGFLLANVAVGGSSTEHWRADTTPYFNGPVALALNPDPDLVLVEPMIYNDISRGYSVDKHKTDLKSVVQSWMALASKPDVLLVLPGYSSARSDAVYDTYRSAVYQVADDLDLPVLDMTVTFGSFAAARDDGLYAADGLHMTPAGYGIEGRAVARVIR